MVRSYKKLALAFVALSALLLSPFLTVTTHAAAAPCQYNGRGKYNCRFWTRTPVEGQSNGSIARGTNWVVCQARGRTVNVNGWKNDWWGWTLRDNGTGSYGSGWGWVNAVYAKGGDSFEGFAGVPYCAGILPPQAPGSWNFWR